MSQAATYRGKATEDGKFVPDSPAALRALLQTKAKGKKDIAITVDDWKPLQTDPQRRVWFGIVVKRFCEYMGYRFNNKDDREFVHHQILIACGRYDIKKIFGKEEKVAHSMKRGSMTTEQFSELLADVQQLGAEQGVVIPDPNSVEGLGMLAAYQ